MPLSSPRRVATLLLLAGVVAAGAPAVAAAATAGEALARGDAAWSRRAEGAQGGRAAAAPIAAAVAAYEEALKADPSSLEAHWKLLRALWFQGDYVAADNAAKQRVFGRGREVSEAAWAVVARRAGRERVTAERAADRAAALRAVPEAPPLLLWSAANWGLWGEAFGKLAAARQGVGGKVRDWAETLIVLDPRFESGGGHRVLGRLHSEAPKVPLITGWVDRDRAVAELDKAVAIAPADLANRLYLAEALLDHHPSRRARALALLREVAAASPRDEQRVEDAAILAAAARRLEAER
jgi:tetratricopeptide (TPR) repeat protein